jgi:L-sorbose 1-phosphate reductase
MTMDKLEAYKHPAGPLPAANRLWPLYGAGLENFGRDGQPIEVPMPSYGPDELLMRHDACGLCFSDIKIIAQGDKHPRIHRDMKVDPVVMGHEVVFTVVGVGENLRGQYKVGDRLTLQPDTIVNGVPLAYGYMYQGGLSQYTVVDQRILNTDHGNHLIPFDPALGYAEVALAEPWACVVAAYRLKYRTGLKPGGTAWVIGRSASAGGPSSRAGYRISAGFDASSHPARLLMTGVPADFSAWLRKRASELKIEIVEVTDLAAPALESVDDIIFLDPAPETIEAASPRLAMFGVAALMAASPLPRKVNVDIGRVHYRRWVYAGSTGLDVAAAYQDVPVRANLKPGGRAWFVGAGGPMGRMHVQRAIQFANPPSIVVCTDVSDMRLNDLRISFEDEAKARGIEFICLNPADTKTNPQGIKGLAGDGFDDVVVLVPVPAVIADSANYVAPTGVMNVFAGVALGTLATLDLSDAYLRGVRVIGHSASDMDDMLSTVRKAETGELSPNRAVAAVGSLGAARAGLEALKATTYPGKVVIYPHIKEMPLTSLPELEEKMPTVFAKLRNGREWTNEAEAEFLRLMLP